jgi:hypothetical protein
MEDSSVSGRSASETRGIKRQLETIPAKQTVPKKLIWIGRVAMVAARLIRAT